MQSTIMEVHVVALDNFPLLWSQFIGIRSIYEEGKWFALFFVATDISIGCHIHLKDSKDPNECYSCPLENRGASLGQTNCPIGIQMGQYSQLQFTQETHELQSTMQRHNTLESNNLHLQMENQRLVRELGSIKVELYQLYEENIGLRDALKQGQKDRQLLKECQSEVGRLKTLLKEITVKKDSMPSEREEIKDRIIMKLEDQLISTKIELKEVSLQLQKFTRIQ